MLIDGHLLDGCLIEDQKNDSAGQIWFFKLLLYKYLLFFNLFDGNQMSTDTTEHSVEDCICDLGM